MFGWKRRKTKTETASEAEAEEQRSLADPSSWLAGLFGAVPSVAGPVVTPASAMTCAPFACGARVLAESLGSLPVHVFKRGPDGARERERGHQVETLLNDIANGHSPGPELRTQLVLDALLNDQGGLCYVNRAGSGRIVELLRFLPGSVTVDQSPEDGSPIYRHNGGETIPRENVLHLRSPSGRSAVSEGKQAIGLIMAMEAHAARLFANGGRPSGLLKFPNRLAAETAARIRASWHAATSGERSGATAVLEEGGDFTPLSFNSVDSQFLQLREFGLGEIARVLNVPSVMLHDLRRATWNNSQDQGARFLRYSLMPWLRRFEGEARLKLLRPEERENLIVEFETSAIVRADLQVRMTAYATAIASRILSPNEARARENLPPYPGGDSFENPNTTPGSTGASDD